MDLDFRINVFCSLRIEQWQRPINCVCVHTLYLSISPSPNVSFECCPRRVAAFQEAAPFLSQAAGPAVQV